MAEGKQECDFCKNETKIEDLVKCAFCGRSFCENCVFGTGQDAMCMECGMVGREQYKL